MLSIFPFLKKSEKIDEQVIENIQNNNSLQDTENTIVGDTNIDNSVGQENNMTTDGSVGNLSEQASMPVDTRDPNRKRVLLVVDDNKLNLKVASKLLSEFNCDIETVQSGRECIEKVQENNKYDLIFMDIMMPDMNGVETMHKLKSMENFHIPVVSLTADAVEGSREKYLGEGFDDYIPKPMNKDEMRNAINKYIDTSSTSTNSTNENSIEEL